MFKALLTLKAMNLFMKTLEAKGFFGLEIIITVLSYLILILLNACVMGLRPLEIFLILQCGDRL